MKAETDPTTATISRCKPNARNLTDDDVDVATLIDRPEPKDGLSEYRRLWQEPIRLRKTAWAQCMQSCGDRVSYVINRNINFTNICVGSCAFCAFRRTDGYKLSIDEILSRVSEAETLHATEICLQGGLAPGMRVEDYCEILEAISNDYPRIHLHAYSPMEVYHMASNSGVSVCSAIEDLKQSGLGSMPGTAAEILCDEVRDRICPSKISTLDWCRIIIAAHESGVPTTSTMLYGHLESMEDRLRHLLILRRIQEMTGGFTEFVLLPFMPWNNHLGESVRANRVHAMDLHDHLKMHALSRVILHGAIRNIQASWVKLGRNAAGSALEWGVNDLGGTLMEENISRSAGACGGQYISPEEICEIIEEHGRVPVQRTTLYGRID